MTAEEVDWPFSLKKAELCLGGEKGQSTSSANKSTYCCRSDPPFMAHMGTTTFCLLYPSLSICTIVTSTVFALGIRIALLMSNLWPGFTLGSFSSSSATSAGSSGAQVYSFATPEREQDQRNSSSTRLSWIIAAIIGNLL